MSNYERDDCHLCGTECIFKLETISGKITETIECSQCGHFRLTDKFSEMIKESRLQNAASRAKPINDFYYKQFVIYLRQAMWIDCIKRFQRELSRKLFIEYRL